MTNQVKSHVNTAEWQAYADRLYIDLKAYQNTIFQSRKIGIYITIPENVRALIKERYGAEGERFLNMVDGEVLL